MSIINAKVDSFDIRFDRGFVLTAWLFASDCYGTQGFGGFVLGGSPFDEAVKCARHVEQPNIAAEFIGAVLRIADVECAHEVVGKIIRVERDAGGMIVAIGHPVKDIWFNPSKTFDAWKEAGAWKESVQ